MEHQKHSPVSVQMSRPDRELLDRLRDALMRNASALPDDLLERLVKQGRSRSFSYADVLGVAIEFTLRAFATLESPSLEDERVPDEPAQVASKPAEESTGIRRMTAAEADAIVEGMAEKIRAKDKR